MISTDELSNSWNSISPQRGSTVGRRADPSHPLDFFISYDESNFLQLMLITNDLPWLPQSSKQISVRGNKRKDNKYAVCFSLIDGTLKDLFVSLSWDLLYCTKDIHDAKVGAETAVRRFALWQKLMATTSGKAMTESAAKGLMGELIVLRDHCIPNYGIDDAIKGWVGPLYEDRDYEYSDKWIEVKSTSLSRDTIRISSLDQLDTTRNGMLMIARIEKSSELIPEARTLNEIVAEIKLVIDTSPDAKDLFLTRLNATGFSCADQSASISFVLHEIEKYNVDTSFPRIARSGIDRAIVNGTYDISIPAIHNWRI